MCRFLMVCFSAVCFFINVSFRAVVGALWAFLSSRHSSALYCFYCIASVLMNKIFIFIHSTRGSFLGPPKSTSQTEACWSVHLFLKRTVVTHKHTQTGHATCAAVVRIWCHASRCDIKITSDINKSALEPAACLTNFADNILGVWGAPIWICGP